MSIWPPGYLSVKKRKDWVEAKLQVKLEATLCAIIFKCVKTPRGIYSFINGGV